MLKIRECKYWVSRRASVKIDRLMPIRTSHCMDKVYCSFMCQVGSIYRMFRIQDILYTGCSMYRMFCDATAELQERVVQIVWNKMCLLNCSSFWHCCQVTQCRTVTLIINFFFNVPLLSTFQTFTTTPKFRTHVRNVQQHTVAYTCCQSLFHWMLPRHASCFLIGINSDLIYVLY